MTKTANKTKIIVFTDLDGTMIDRDTYSFEIALPLLKELKKSKIPVIFCTAKTKKENEYYQKKLKVECPFIVENGGAIFIPKNYFSYEIASLRCGLTRNDNKKMLLARNDKVFF